LASLVFAIAYSRSTVFNIVVLASFGLLVELTQLLIPDRHARLTDLVENIVGVLIGIAVVAAVKLATGRWTRL
jgi:VanZ family protein